MLFRVCDHYYENELLVEKNENAEENNDECFICFEKTIHKELPIHLKCQKMYITVCNCNGLIHNFCLQIWYNKSKKCPICRIGVREKIQLNVYLYSYLYPYYLYFLLTLHRISKIMLTLFMIYYSFEVYLLVFNTRSKINVSDYSYFSFDENKSVIVHPKNLD